ncbi:MAG: extracellular solute-binding protein [Ignavibacteriaceae bacterium]|nr:extracellular solute-binding protein [Ignavibacteriaceae bacterium]
MQFSKIFYVIVSTILVTAFMLIIYVSRSGNVNDKEEGKPVKIYFADNISSAHRAVINRFNEMYKGRIEVVPIDLPFNKFTTNDRKELLARYFRSKSDRIDVFSVDLIWVPRFARWAMPLDEYLPDSEKTQLLKYALKSCYYKDTLVAIPLYLDVAMMYYRKDLVEKLENYKQVEDELKNSITWERFIELSKSFNSNPFYVFQADDYEGLMCQYTEILDNMNGKLMDNSSLMLNTPQAENALSYLTDLVNKYKISPVEVLRFKEDDSYKYYLQNNGVFLRGWTGLFQNNAIGKKYINQKDNLVEVPLPHIKGSKPASVFGGWDLMVSRFSSKIPESIRFIKFLMSEEAQKILFEEGGYIPINNRIYNDPSYNKESSRLECYYRLVQNGIYRPFSEQYTNVSDILSYYINLSLKGTLTPHDALYKANEKLKSKSILLK